MLFEQGERGMSLAEDKVTKGPTCDNGSPDRRMQ